ncbi:MAG TPA: response regulator [Chloroflexota bacterium]|nr:response regulator [Chloroflexota bacterium]
MERTLLVVEDEPEVRALVELTLRGLGRIVSVGDGPSGLVAAAQHRPDLILIDVNLPGMSGLELCERLRADPATRHATIAFLTAGGTAEDRQRGMAAGADAYFVKPFSPAALRAFVAERLGAP